MFCYTCDAEGSPDVGEEKPMKKNKNKIYQIKIVKTTESRTHCCNKVNAFIYRRICCNLTTLPLNLMHWPQQYQYFSLSLFLSPSNLYAFLKKKQQQKVLLKCTCTKTNIICVKKSAFTIVVYPVIRSYDTVFSKLLLFSLGFLFFFGI